MDEIVFDDTLFTNQDELIEFLKHTYYARKDRIKVLNEYIEKLEDAIRLFGSNHPYWYGHSKESYARKILGDNYVKREKEER